MSTVLKLLVTGHVEISMAMQLHVFNYAGTGSIHYYAQILNVEVQRFVKRLGPSVRGGAVVGSELGAASARFCAKGS